MNKIRNILVFGRTGNGKSALANVLIGKNKFKESDSGVSETKKYKDEKFEYDDSIHGLITYRIIDTIGIGDTQLTDNEVLYEMGTLAKVLREDGINRILFVVRNKFTKEEVTAFNVLNKVLFDEEVFEHTTIVRSGFPRFSNVDECNDDFKALKGESQDSFPIISKMTRDNVIYVNNPSIDTDDKNEYNVALKNREASRKILLKHLGERSEIYRPKNIDNLGKKVEEHIKEKNVKEEENSKEIQRLKSKMEEIEEQINRDRKKWTTERNRLDNEREKLKDKIDSERDKLSDEVRKRKTECDRLDDEIMHLERKMKDENANHQELKKKVDELQNDSKDLARDLKKHIAQTMENHVEKKLTGLEKIEFAASAGARIGTTALPLIGTAAGGLIGTSVGIVAYFVDAFRGK